MRTRSFFILSLLTASLLASPASARAQSAAREDLTPPSTEIVPGEIVVGMKASYSVAALRMPTGVSLARTSQQLTRLNVAVLRVPAGQEVEYASRFQNTEGVQFAEPNYRVQVALIPNDTYWPQQYGPSQILAPAAWDLTTGSGSVTVAVIDSGLDSSHPEFAGRILPGYDFVEDDSTPQDGCGHGTHVTGIIAARGNNADGIAGMAWEVMIMPLRVLNNYCSGSTADVAEALVWAVERGVRVINLSLGTSAPSTLLENGTYYAYTHGAAIFAAAGNAGSSPVFYPAAYPWVMAVAATDQTSQRATYSNYGAALDLITPGSDIYSTLPTSPGFLYNTPCPNPPFPCGKSTQYDALSGTSMAAAHASGAAALLASLPQFDTPDKIYQALTATALDMDVPGRDDNTGYGLIQTADALAFVPTIVPTPTPALPSVSYDILDSSPCANLVQYQWRDATSGGPGNWLPVFGNDGFITAALPFTFTFGGQTYANVTVSANGYLTFGGIGSAKDNFIIPSIAQPNNFIAPFWDDLNPSAGGLLYHATFGSAPTREYVIEWHQVPRVGVTGSALTFEVILFEGNNEIKFQYHTLSGTGADGSSATIGVEYADGSAGREYAYNRVGAVTAGQALLFVPYATGTTPPSNACTAFTHPVDTTGGFFDAPPFCVNIPAGALQHPATLQIQLLSNAPHIPDKWLDLGHYANITLAFSPAPPLSPMPEVYVCYHYTAQDVLQAGGHPHNLFIAAYSATASRWESLPTTVDTNQSLLTARAPHLSIFSIAALQPSGLPVTGAPLAWDTATCLSTLILILGLAIPLRRIIRKKI